MSATDIPVDVDVLREEIRKAYTDVSTEQEQEFIFPTGRGWAQELGYPEPELSRVPDATVTASQASRTTGRSDGSSQAPRCWTSAAARGQTC